MAGGQYGEDKILEEFFQGKDRGFVLDAGAANGSDNSNSYHLLMKGWNGLLIEPEPIQFAALQALWNRDGIELANTAIGLKAGKATFYACEQVSTMSEEFRDSCIKRFGVTYTETTVPVKGLDTLLLQTYGFTPFPIDFLTIDCEGMDLDVLATLSLHRYKPKLICLEVPTTIPGYSVYTKTNGNTFYRRNDVNK